MGKLVMRVAHVAPIRARCFNSKRTSFHVALELEHVESVDLRSAIRKADAVLPAFAREGQRGHTVKRVARAEAGVWIPLKEDSASEKTTTKNFRKVFAHNVRSTRNRATRSIGPCAGSAT